MQSAGPSIRVFHQLQTSESKWIYILFPEIPSQTMHTLRRAWNRNTAVGDLCSTWSSHSSVLSSSQESIILLYCLSLTCSVPQVLKASEYWRTVLYQAPKLSPDSTGCILKEKGQHFPSEIAHDHLPAAEMILFNEWKRFRINQMWGNKAWRNSNSWYRFNNFLFLLKSRIRCLNEVLFIIYIPGECLAERMINFLD